jgi:hypothetical protein
MPYRCALAAAYPCFLLVCSRPRREAQAFLTPVRFAHSSRKEREESHCILVLLVPLRRALFPLASCLSKPENRQAFASLREKFLRSAFHVPSPSSLLTDHCIPRFPATLRLCARTPLLLLRIRSRLYARHKNFLTPVRYRSLKPQRTRRKHLLFLVHLLAPQFFLLLASCLSKPENRQAFAGLRERLLHSALIRHSVFRPLSFSSQVTHHASLPLVLQDIV